MTHRSASWFVFLLLVFGLFGCKESPEPASYVARVGNAFLSEETIRAAMEDLSNRQDSTQYRQQIIDQWVTNELLYQEALREGLLQTNAVKKRLEESQRAILVDALLLELYREETTEITAAEIQAYFEEHQENLRLREPFVRVYYLYTTSQDSAATCQKEMQRALRNKKMEEEWPKLVAQYAHDAPGSLVLSATYVPESRLFGKQPYLRQLLGSLRADQVSNVLFEEDRYHILALGDRVPVGTIPQPHWVEAEVRRLLTLDKRKQMYQRLVQRLRNEASAQDLLSTP